MDAALEKLRNEYRRCKAVNPLNLSGKRTESKSKGDKCAFADMYRAFFFGAAARQLLRFFIERKSSHVGIT